MLYRPPGLLLSRLLLIGLLCSTPLSAQDLAQPPTLNEHSMRLPVELRVGREAKPHHGELILTSYRPDGDGPFPLVILNHGRTSSQRHSPERQRMMPLAGYFVRRGFAVLVPTRLGYGGTGQNPDPEYSGTCARKDYEPAVLAMTTQLQAVLSHARSLPWVDATRLVVAGHSAGGLATLAFAASQPPGLLAYVNFSGGLGGDAVEHPGEPCGSAALASLFARFGTQVRAPGLWLYAENDELFNSSHARHWFAQFNAAHGKAGLSMFGPVGNKGHNLMTAAPELWRPVLNQFLAEHLQLPLPATPGAPPPSGHAQLEDMDAIPWLSVATRQRFYGDFLASDLPRALAISPDGKVGWASNAGDPRGRALAICQRSAQQPCVLYAVDKHVVWKPAAP